MRSAALEYHEALFVGDGRRACRLLTPRARRDIIETVPKLRAAGLADSCQEAINQGLGVLDTTDRDHVAASFARAA